MKKTFLIAITALVALLCTSCSDDPDNNNDTPNNNEQVTDDKEEDKTVVSTGDASEITPASATVLFKVYFANAGSYTSFDAGVCWCPDGQTPSLDLADVGHATIEHDKLGAPDKSGSYSILLSNLEQDTKYNYVAYAIFDNKVSYGKVRNFTTTSIVIEDGDYVDLGLSVKWATKNLGASAPEEYGDYYAWGETNTKTSYTWANYPMAQSNYARKYCINADQGNVDGRTTLMACDDAASAKLGDKWRMPTKTEIREMLSNTEFKPYQLNGVAGWLFTSKTNAKSIFLPSAGMWIGTNVEGKGEICGIWSSTLCDNNNSGAKVATSRVVDSDTFKDAGFSLEVTGSQSFDLWTDRYYGIPIRPVYAENTPQKEAYEVSLSDPIDIAAMAATLQVNITPSAEAEHIGVYYTSASTDDCPNMVMAETQEGKANGRVVIRELQPNTNYRAMAYAVVKGIKYYGNTIQFTTPHISATVQALDVTNISHCSATFHAKALGDIEAIQQYYPDVTYGIAYNTIDRSTQQLAEQTTYSSYISQATAQPADDGTYSITLQNLESYSQYYINYFKAFVKIGDHYFWSQPIFFETKDIPIHPWVDLGPQVSVLWAGVNLGAPAPDANGYYEGIPNLMGNRYAWGEVEPKETFTANNYSLCQVDADGNVHYTKYTHSDCITTLTPDNDAATHLDSSQRTPTKEEWEELIAACQLSAINYYGQRYVKFTSKSNGNYILFNSQEECNFWSSTVYLFTNTFTNLKTENSAWCYKTSAVLSRTLSQELRTGYGFNGGCVRAVKSK